MPTFETDFHVDAPPDVVWEVMTDIGRWPEWTPTVKRVVRDDSGPLRIGSRARLWLRGVLYGTNWTVTELQPGRSFMWESSVFPGIHERAIHEVRPDGDGAWVVLRIEAGGPLAVALSPVYASASRQNLKLESEGLARESEAHAAAGS